MTAYYNEIDPFAAEWLRILILYGHIAPGDVDTRDIKDVCPDDLRPYRQCHFFAGIGVWSYALRNAGWNDSRPVWTGSCPCQPFSAAGKGGGFDDERHLWPAFHHLIRECRPYTIFGEQVASKDGLNWLDLVQSDLEGEDYAVGAVDLCAAGVGAPHIRQRLWWMAHASGQQQHRSGDAGRRRREPTDGSSMVYAEGEQERLSRCARLSGGTSSAVDHADERRHQSENDALRTGWHTPQSSSGLGHHHHHQPGLEGRSLSGSERPDELTPWAASDFVWCRDEKWRPVESGTFPLAHGAPARVGRLRGYGNAINAEAAKVFIETAMTLI